MQLNNFNAAYVPNGFQMSEPTRDPVTVRDQLNYLHAVYPGQCFVIENSGGTDDSRVVISWIPDWLTPFWIGGLLGQAIYESVGGGSLWAASSSLAWPAK
jgi:hypothetical protein